MLYSKNKVMQFSLCQNKQMLRLWSTGMMVLR